MSRLLPRAPRAALARHTPLRGRGTLHERPSIVDQREAVKGRVGGRAGGPSSSREDTGHATKQNMQGPGAGRQRRVAVKGWPGRQGHRPNKTCFCLRGTGKGYTGERPASLQGRLVPKAALVASAAASEPCTRAEGEGGGDSRHSNDKPGDVALAGAAAAGVLKVCQPSPGQGGVGTAGAQAPAPAASPSQRRPMGRAVQEPEEERREQVRSTI